MYSMYYCKRTRAYKKQKIGAGSNELYTTKQL